MSAGNRIHPKSSIASEANDNYTNSAVDDLPPSYALAIFRQTVNKAIEQQRHSKQTVIMDQPSNVSSPHLSKQSSLASTELILNPQTIPSNKLKGRRSHAWSDTVVVK